jgi:deazaflavin-dependent oxidoreductase (nitroreductase family)
VRGRRTGQLRTFPVATLHADGRQYLFSPFGDVAWVHNLRADGRAVVGRGRRRTAVEASELSQEDAARKLETALRPVLRVPFMGPMIAGWYGINARSTAADYLEAARRHPGFELRSAEEGSGPEAG